jgi:hypothetical protein
LIPAQNSCTRLGGSGEMAYRGVKGMPVNATAKIGAPCSARSAVPADSAGERFVFRARGRYGEAESPPAVGAEEQLGSARGAGVSRSVVMRMIVAYRVVWVVI